MHCFVVRGLFIMPPLFLSPRSLFHTFSQALTNACTHKKKGVLFGRKRKEYPVVYGGQTFPFGKLILIAEIKNFCGLTSFNL